MYLHQSFPHHRQHQVSNLEAICAFSCSLDLYILLCTILFFSPWNASCPNLLLYPIQRNAWYYKKNLEEAVWRYRLSLQLCCVTFVKITSVASSIKSENLIRLWMKSFYFSIIKDLAQQMSVITPPFSYPLKYLESLRRHSKFSVSCAWIVFPASSFKTGIPCWIHTLPSSSWIYSILVIFPCLCFVIYTFGPNDWSVIYLYSHTVLSLKIHTVFPCEILHVLPAQFKCSIVCKLNPGSWKPKCQNTFRIYSITYPRLPYISIEQIFTSLTEFYLPDGHYLI